jgi:hypothetical protein
MRTTAVLSTIALVLAFNLSLNGFELPAYAQRNQAAPASVPPPPGWKACPRCQNNADRKEAAAKYKVEGHPFDPHDLSGVWGFGGMADAFTNPPPLTASGKVRFDATIGEKGPDGVPLHTKDTSGEGASLINCDPLGYPRLHTRNYGIELVMLPDRVIQFFDIGHTWRTIWTDGRKLPAEPTEPRWMGWNVGHWEGNVFVIESNGYDDRSWLDAARPDGGFIHSEEMRIEERVRRTNFGTLEWEMTVIDPKTYTKPWVTPKATIKLVPGTELGENFCVPSDYQQFNQLLLPGATGLKK